MPACSNVIALLSGFFQDRQRRIALYRSVSIMPQATAHEASIRSIVFVCDYLLNAL